VIPPQPASSSIQQQGKTFLPRELGAFLVAFSIAVHRFAMYPSGHPTLRPSADAVLQRLSVVLARAPSLSIGVGSRQLVVQGLPTDPRHPVLSDLARRLHDHHLAALSLLRGVALWEVEGFLRRIAEDPVRSATPVGLGPEEEREEWPHIHLFPIGYERLALGGALLPGDEKGGRASELWLALARAALSEEVEADGAATDPEGVALALSSRRPEERYDRMVVGYLQELARELRQSSEREAETVRRRVSELLERLDESTLKRLVASGPGRRRAAGFVLDVNQSLSVEAVTRLLQAAASTTGETISTSLIRLLSKLAEHSRLGEGPIRTLAEEAFRENVDELLERWVLEDPNPEEYTLMLDTMARSAPPPATASRGGDPGGPSGSGLLRVVSMALELDVWGPMVEESVSRLLADGGLGGLLKLVDDAPTGTRVAARLSHELTSPAQIRRFLAGDDVDEEALYDLVRRSGPRAIDPLLEALSASETRSVRRKLFDQLVGLGDGTVPPVLLLLEDSRWYVQRNMLALLQRVPRLPDGLDFLPFLAHADPRVQREALPLALRDPATRERALALGLADADERLVRVALAEAQGGLPESLVPTVLSRILEREELRPLHAPAVRALRGSRSSLVLEKLISLVFDPGGFFTRGRLRTPSPEGLAALRILAEEWSEDPRAERVLSEARRARDVRILEALARPEGDEADQGET